MDMTVNNYLTTGGESMATYSRVSGTPTLYELRRRVMMRKAQEEKKKTSKKRRRHNSEIIF
jgi:hypothetical protein